MGGRWEEEEEEVGVGVGVGVEVGVGEQERGENGGEGGAEKKEGCLRKSPLFVGWK